MTSEIKAAWDSGNGNALIYTAVIAAIVANCTPTPADAIYFRRQQVDKALLNDQKITPKQFWLRNTFGYYFYTAAWYGAVLLVVTSANVDYKTKAKIGIALLSAGIIVGVVSKNIQKDQAIADSKKIAGK